MHPRPRKLLVAAVSGTLTALVAWAVLGDRPAVEARTVELVDNTEALSELLRSRQAEPVPVPGSPAGEPPVETLDTVPATTPSAPSMPRAAGTLRTMPPVAVIEPDYPPVLLREPITEELARDAFYLALRRKSLYEFNPQTHLWPRTNHQSTRRFPEHPDGEWIYRTNSLGFLKDVEVLDPPPRMRVVVAGDSHTAGVVPNSESYANVLEQLLLEQGSPRDVEVLNAGVGGTSMYQYLGVLEYVEDLVDPQVLVVCLYGGNDFTGVMALDRYYHRRAPPVFGPHGGRRLKQLPATGVISQVVVQVAYFLDNPADVQFSLEAVDSITVEMERRCREAGIELVFVYLPPATSAQPERYEQQLMDALDALAIDREDIGFTDTLAAQWMAFLERRGLTYVDMTPAFSASEEACYWSSDLHINTHGHRLVAEALERVIAPLGL